MYRRHAIPRGRVCSETPLQILPSALNPVGIMNAFEKVSTWVRHLPLLEQAEWLWNPVRPIYDRAVNHFGHYGLERVVNGTDRILISPKLRGIPEEYEREVWRALMAELKADDTFVDIGAFVGLYSIAVARRLQNSGRVVAFEPGDRNYSLLKEQVRLNRLKGRIELHHAAVSDQNGRSSFLADGSSEARLISTVLPQANIVKVVTIDRIFVGRRIDVLKIDVEGHEEKVLRGAGKILRAQSLRPRAIFIEVHPFAWPSLGVTIDSFLSTLANAGYQAETIHGKPIAAIEGYGEIVARPMS
jgi:FkbM family methyltransferase